MDWDRLLSQLLAPQLLRCQALRVTPSEKTVVLLKRLCALNGLQPQFTTAQNFFDEFVELN